MKKLIILSFAVLAFSLTACQKAPASSSQSTFIPGSSSQSVSSSDLSQSDSTSKGTSAPGSETASEDITSDGWPTSFISLRDASGETVLVEVKAPVDWQFDGTSTFFVNEQKVLEIAGLESITDKQMPFKAAYNDQYVKTPEGIPEGFGYISTDEITLPSCSAVLHMWKMWPDDSDKPWYPHCYFVEKGDYLVSANFYTFEENCTSLHKTYDVVLNEIEIFK